MKVKERAAGKFGVVEYFHFNEKVKHSEAKKLVNGPHCFNLSWSANKQVTTKILLHMMRNFGGHHFRYASWPEEWPKKGRGKGGNDKDPLTKEDIEAGFKLLREEAPRGNFDGEQLEWMMQQYIDPTSPINRFDKGSVKEMLGKLTAKGNLATTQDYCPIAWGDIPDWMQLILLPLLPLLLTTTMLLLGEAKQAKTPLNMILAFMFARFWGFRLGHLAEVGMRMTTDMDFFRGEEGKHWIPCIFDDGDLWDQRIRVLKAFFDPTQFEAMVYARWGACKFVRGSKQWSMPAGGHASSYGDKPASRQIIRTIPTQSRPMISGWWQPHSSPWQIRSKRLRASCWI